MGRTMIAAISVIALAGCSDWREGEENVEACIERFALKKGAVDPLTDDSGQWVPSYTYDVTKLQPEALRSLIKISPKEGQTEGIMVLGGTSSQRARDDFEDRPATEAGLLLKAKDSALFKVRGEPGLYRDLLRQGCERQRAGMRLIRWGATREDQLVNGELPPASFKAADMRAVEKHIKPAISTEDLLP